YEFTGNNIDQIIAAVVLEQEEIASDDEFASILLKKCLEDIEEIDKLIINKLENWDFSRIALIDKLILRLAIAELLSFEDIPPKVTIDEAIEIAKKFSTEKSGGFINGILNAVYKDLYKKGKLIKTGRGLIDKSLKDHKELNEKKTTGGEEKS
ncbi:transcription antitermination factor NusB, partial [candidate division KSB1 bacterium]